MSFYVKQMNASFCGFEVSTSQSDKTVVQQSCKSCVNLQVLFSTGLSVYLAKCSSIKQLISQFNPIKYTEPQFKRSVNNFAKLYN